MILKGFHLPKKSNKRLIYLTIKYIGIIFPIKLQIKASKYELLKLIKDIYKLDVEIQEFGDYKSNKILNSEQYAIATGFVSPSWSVMIKEMLESENPLTSLMAGKIKLHVYMTPPSPAQEIDFVL